MNKKTRIIMYSLLAVLIILAGVTYVFTNSDKTQPIKSDSIDTVATVGAIEYHIDAPQLNILG